ncbi:MAG: hypothetical protein ACRYE9_00120 [Janthinobacterium lividum]
MMCITLALKLFEILKKSYLVILGIFGLFLIGKNSKLAKENEKLNIDIKDNSRIIKTQNQVIHAMQNNQAVDLNTNIKRMYQNKL